MSYPTTLTEAVYPYVSLMALPDAHHSVLGTLPITQEWSKSIFDRFSQILWELANDETFICSITTLFGGNLIFSSDLHERV